jgi:hypothetical protein
VTYTQRVDRSTPSCMIFLVDQSGSMTETMAGTQSSKADVVAEQLNSTVMELIQRCSKSHTELPRRYFAVSILGYSTNNFGTPIVGPLLSIPNQVESLTWSTDLAQHPLRIEQRTKQTSDGSLTYRMPIWVESNGKGGTPMCAAFNQAGQIASAWIKSYPASFPPIIINLTDGESTDGNPTQWADRIKALESDDGNALLFNVMLSDKTKNDPQLFPSERTALSGRYPRMLFDMSSELPEIMIDAARRQGHPVSTGARGMSMNADFRAVVSFLSVGTSISHMLR